MLKKIVISLVLFAIVIATAMYFMNKTESPSKESSEEVIELSEEEAQAIELLNEEMIQDQCVVYADEDNVKDEALKEYLSSCVEQLKAEATMIEPEENAKTEKEIRKQCAVYAQQDAIKKEKLEDYMDLCIEQLGTEAIVIEPEDEETTKEVVTEEKQIKGNTEVLDTKSADKKASETLK